jgi:hypothetical protein
MEEKILTLHPENKKGVNISKRKYEVMKSAIIATLRETGEMAFKDLPKAVRKKLEGKFEGKITWYVVTVKLDLEARGIVERIPKKSPQRIRLAHRT